MLWFVGYYDPLRFGPPPGPRPVEGLLPTGVRLVEEDDLLHQQVSRGQRALAAAVVLLFGVAMVVTTFMTAAAGLAAHHGAQATLSNGAPDPAWTQSSRTPK